MISVAGNRGILVKYEIHERFFIAGKSQYFASRDGRLIMRYLTQQTKQSHQGPPWLLVRSFLCPWLQKGNAVPVFDVGLTLLCSIVLIVCIQDIDLGRQ